MSTERELNTWNTFQNTVFQLNTANTVAYYLRPLTIVYKYPCHNITSTQRVDHPGTDCKKYGSSWAGRRQHRKKYYIEAGRFIPLIITRLCSMPGLAWLCMIFNGTKVKKEWELIENRYIRPPVTFFKWALLDCDKGNMHTLRLLLIANF